MPAAAARRSGRGSIRMSGGRSGMFPPCPPMLGEGAGGKHCFFWSGADGHWGCTGGCRIPKARGSNERRGHHERTYHHQRRPTTGHHPPGLHQQCGLGLQPAARPAKSSIEDVLHLPERLEAWAWRGLLREAAPAQAPEASPPQAPPDTAQADLTSVNTRRPGQVASEKQLQALYAIGQRRGLDRAAVQARVHEQLGKAVEALTSREASGLISQWLDQ
jgi:hypothetical protein